MALTLELCSFPSPPWHLPSSVATAPYQSRDPPGRSIGGRVVQGCHGNKTTRNSTLPNQEDHKWLHEYPLALLHVPSQASLSNFPLLKHLSLPWLWPKSPPWGLPIESSESDSLSKSPRYLVPAKQPGQATFLLWLQFYIHRVLVFASCLTLL